MFLYKVFWDAYGMRMVSGQKGSSAMYRILLVDDEIHICQLIEHLVNWEELGAEMCGTAQDGVEAY